MGPISNDDFEAAVTRTRLGPTAIRMARAVLLEGVSKAEAGRREGQTRASAGQAAQRVLREYRGAGGYPRDWVVRTVVVPQEVAAEIDDIVERAHKTAGLV